MQLARFVNQLSTDLKTAGRSRMASACRSAVHSVSKCCDPVRPTLQMVYTKGFLHRYEEHLTRLGRKRNTISFYMSVLRSIYKFAVKKKLLPYTPDLFAGVFTGSEPTRKRAVDVDVIVQLHCADLSAAPHLELCRNLFVLSFHLQGMPFIDLAHLRKSDIREDSVVYYRHKTKGLVRVSMTDPARELLDRYIAETGDSPYALPLITLSGSKKSKQYQAAIRQQNRQLKTLAEYLGIKENLTSYVARHSWATIAYHNDVSVSVVSEAMGHQGEEVTRVYLDSFAYHRLAEANRIVLDAILRPIREGRVTPYGRTEEQGQQQEQQQASNPEQQHSTHPATETTVRNIPDDAIANPKGARVTGRTKTLLHPLKRHKTKKWGFIRRRDKG